MRSKGFLGFGLQAYAMIAVGVVIAAMAIGLKVQTSRLHAAVERYDLFVANTLAVGAAQEAKTKASIAHAEQITKETTKAYEARLADINAKYDRLRNPSPGSSGVPAIPEAARSADAAANDNRLLEVLRRAEEQTLILQQLQDWARSQGG